MTLIDWAVDNEIHLPPPNNKGLVLIAGLDTLSREALKHLNSLSDYTVASRTKRAVWLKKRVPPTARSGSR